VSDPKEQHAGDTVLAVVVTWRGRRTISGCVDSLLAQGLPSGTRLDVLVVDNASDDGTAEILAAYGSRIRVKRLDQNLGFAGGVAAATVPVGVDWLLLLNDDAELQPDALRRLLAAADQTTGAVTATVLLSGRYRLQHTPAPGALTDGAGVWAIQDPAGITLVNSTGNVVDRWGRGSDRDWLRPLADVSSPPEVFGFCGGAALLRTTALREAGGFDAGLFLYYEDTDLSWRLRATGWGVVWAPEARAHHRHAASTGTESPTFRLYNTRNSLRVALRYLPWSGVVGAWARAGAGAVLASIRRTPAATARWRGMAGAVSSLPRDLAERRRWRRRASRNAERHTSS